MKQVGQNNTSFWLRPWSYGHGFVINLSAIVVGIVIEIIFAGRLALRLVYPVNLVFLASFIVLIMLSYFALRKTQFLNNFCNIRQSICIIAAIALAALVGGIVPQDSRAVSQFAPLLASFGITHIFSSWPFLFLVCLFLFHLALVIMRRRWELTLKNVAFYLNHIGIWLVVAAMGFGAGDVVRLRMELEEGKYSWIGFGNHGESYELPFAIKLNDFSLTEYAPDIVLVDRGVAIGGKETVVGDKPLSAVKGDKGRLGDYDVHVLNHIPSAVLFGGKYIAVDSPMAIHAVQLRITDRQTQNVTEDWVTTRGAAGIAKAIDLGSNYRIGLLDPKPKEFLSVVEVVTKEATVDSTRHFGPSEIRVNQPLRINGWNIYQTSYDEHRGKWSTVSIVEAISDPWLPAVYLGLSLTLAGALAICIIRQ